MKRRLGVNIDHIATLREARKARYPDPLDSLSILKVLKVEQVTIHLREDRRHIQDHDLDRILTDGSLPVNLEMAVTPAMVNIALKKSPATCTFVPEKRQEITTEGGLDCVKTAKAIASAIARLKKAGRHISLFIDPKPEQIRMASRLGADAIELHTGTYCEHYEAYFKRWGTYALDPARKGFTNVERSLKTLAEAAALAEELKLRVYAGHGLHTENLPPVVQIPQIEEYNIGHAIIARAVFVGLKKAVREIQDVLKVK